MLISFAFLGLLTVLFLLPNYFSSKAVNDGGKKAGRGLVNKTSSHSDGLEYYDIRLDKSKSASESLATFRQSSGNDASTIANLKNNLIQGEKELSSKSSSSLNVEYNQDLENPEVISPKSFGEKSFLTSATNVSRAETLRNFSKQNDQLLGLNDNQFDELKVVADYQNPSGNMGFAQLAQRINDVPVFRGEIKAGFTKDGKIVRIINNLAPGLNEANISSDFGDPLDAVKAAAGHINYELQRPDVTRNEAASDTVRVKFGEGDWATTAEKMYFPTEIGVARPAWRVLIWQPVNAFYVIVDAETGTMLWRKNITEDQTQAATYEVYANPNSYTNFAESPAPLTPGPVAPTTATQGTLLTRTNVTLIGNEGNLSFNNNGWITDGDNTTAGNNTIAGLDLAPPNGVDAPVTGTNRSFITAWNPPPGNPAPGDAPTVQAARDGAVIQMFYVVNRYHDALYRLGFTEQAFNFQNSNFGRGGVGNDRISSEGQDASGTNNANFSTPSDGFPGRMQMYVFTGSTPNRDGTTDVDIIVHELTHGTSNRLHGNSSGLGSQMSRGMGEGWSDWYAHVLTSEPSDPIDGIYTTGGYVLLNNFGVGTGNYYYGIRRFPKAVITSTGGPNNRPYNPLTFADLNVGCNLSDGAFPPSGGGDCDQIHNAGEIWSSMLWEVRALMVQRLGFQVGTQRILQLVTDGMKLAPISPTFIQERDAIIAAARANGNSNSVAADVTDIREGFRRRGMGFSARVILAGPPAQVFEAYDTPNVVIQEPGFLVSDSPGNNDGFPDPGETISLNIPILNNSGKDANNVTVNVQGGANTNYGSIIDGQTITKQINYTIPAGTPCGSSLTLMININGSLGSRTETRIIIVGHPNAPVSENFDGVTAPALPSGWTTSQTGSSVAFVTKTGVSDTAPNGVFTPNTGKTPPTDTKNGAILESPSYTIDTEAGVISFRNNFNTEGGWDGGVLEISIGGGAFQDIITAGGRFITGGYTGVLGVNKNPLDGRNAWTGNSRGYITSTTQLPSSAKGQSVKFRWRFGEDDNTAEIGWYIDSIKVTGGYTCSGAVAPTTKARFDYDGDGKTDVSIFRPGPGEWWYNRSSDTKTGVAQFGSTTDKPVPADFTGDGKTDIAFWRPSTGQWFVLRSEDNNFFALPFGANGDIPAPGDFDGDGIDDIAVFRPSNAVWYIRRSSDSQVQFVSFGVSEDKPTIEDFDGDGKDDIAIFRPSVSEWWQLRSQQGVVALKFGQTGDKAVPADFSGDGKADIAFWRPSNGFWYVLRSDNTLFYAFPFGGNGDIPAPGDYDGDGTADAAVFRPSNSVWYLQQTTSGVGIVQFGLSNDIPTASVYIP